jgi:hypothetical protein
LPPKAERLRLALTRPALGHIPMGAPFWNRCQTGSMGISVRNSATSSCCKREK